MDGDVEYQQLETSRFSNLWENKYWVLSVLVLIIDVVFFLAAVTGLIYAFIENKGPWGFLLIIIVNFLGILLLINGIFGNARRKVSLTFYIIFFQLVPFVINFFAVIFCFIMFETVKSEAKMEFPESDPTLMALYAIGMAILCTLYHIGAAWAVSRYKKTQLEQDPNF